MSNLHSKRVVLGVTGGIAAYKAVTLLRLLGKAGHDVTVVPTASALRMVGLATWQNLSGNPVHTSVFEDFTGAEHVRLGKSADLVVVAGEATAALLAAAGDDVSAADVLRPALEAAAATLGAGVLDNAQIVPVGQTFEDPAVEAFALVDEQGNPGAWFASRVRVNAAPQVSAPKPAFVDAATERTRMRILHDVELVLTAEIGHTRLPMRQVLDLVPGTVLELDKQAGAPADVMVNGRLVARGEVVVVDEDYGIRITELIAPEHGQ